MVPAKLKRHITIFSCKVYLNHMKRQLPYRKKLRWRIQEINKVTNILGVDNMAVFPFCCIKLKVSSIKATKRKPNFANLDIQALLYFT